MVVEVLVAGVGYRGGIPVVRVYPGKREIVREHVLIPEPVYQPGRLVSLLFVRSECSLGMGVQTVNGNYARSFLNTLAL